ncbi:MAG TPA: YezD family protein [Verrucomicrobiales bacterium]|nr:YezD family protein [Verrucomicrobiales bacterium]
MSNPSSSDPEIAAWLQIIERKVAALGFGSVQIIVHEGRVT